MVSDIPQEVRDIIRYTRDRELDMSNYENLYPVAWVQSENPWDARKVFDPIYEDRDHQLWRITRGDPVEIFENGWWILCGFDFD